jgi:hypothetical protein
LQGGSLHAGRPPGGDVLDSMELQRPLVRIPRLGGAQAKGVVRTSLHSKGVWSMGDAVLVTDAFAASPWCRTTLLQLASVALGSLRAAGVTPVGDLIHSAVVADDHVRSQLALDLPGLTLLGWEVHAGAPSPSGQPPAQPMAESLVAARVLTSVAPLRLIVGMRWDAEALANHVSRAVDALPQRVVHTKASELAQGVSALLNS